MSTDSSITTAGAVSAAAPRWSRDDEMAHIEDSIESGEIATMTMNYIPEWPAGAIAMSDDGTGRLAYYTKALGSGFNVYTKVSAKAKARFKKHVETEDEAQRVMDKFMENF